jgi:hypothetical protein
MEQAIPRGYSRKSKFPPWFSHTLRHYVAKKNYFHRRFKKKRFDYFYERFALYRKHVKSTIKSARLRWLKSNISGNAYPISENIDPVQFS